jgi:hypothetical protein
MFLLRRPREHSPTRRDVSKNLFQKPVHIPGIAGAAKTSIASREVDRRAAAITRLMPMAPN